MKGFITMGGYCDMFIQMDAFRVCMLVGMFCPWFPINMLSDSSRRNSSFFYVINCVTHFCFFVFSDYIFSFCSKTTFPDSA
ncbi:hypothetical protein DNA98_17545 [Meiothermus sp. Pnk-1]|nr:hypothetical protein DNA98_17545 [Meiothermus sp. Pnk-1]